MIRNDEGAVALKHRVVEGLARMEWEDRLTEQNKEALAYEISPGPHATWRCCVYKEREILRWRMRLASNENASVNKPSKNIIQVIEPACEECPLSSYTVTDNCRLCLGKACMNSCRFGAISISDTRAKIDPNMCRECGMCANACPYGAIAHLVRPCKRLCPVDAISYDEYGICVINEEKCIRCGQCIHSCPFGAIDSKVHVLDVIRAIKPQRIGDVASGSSDRICFSVKTVDQGVVTAGVDLPFPHEEAVGDARQLPEGLVILVYDGKIGQVGTGHYQALQTFAKEQMMDRRVG